MKKLDYLYSFGMLLLVIAFIILLFYRELLGELYWPQLIVLGILGVIVSLVYRMVTCEESVRIPLDVVMIDNRIDMWRGKLCSAQHEDDIELESQALIHIDVYQDLRILHGLKALAKVK